MDSETGQWVVPSDAVLKEKQSKAGKVVEQVGFVLRVKSAGVLDGDWWCEISMQDEIDEKSDWDEAAGEINQ